MDEALLREACRKYDEMRIEQLMQSLDMQPIHIFSKQYEKEKYKIIRRYETDMPWLIRIKLKPFHIFKV